MSCINPASIFTLKAWILLLLPRFFHWSRLHLQYFDLIKLSPKRRRPKVAYPCLVTWSRLKWCKDIDRQGKLGSLRSSDARALKGKRAQVLEAKIASHAKDPNLFWATFNGLPGRHGAGSHSDSRIFRQGHRDHDRLRSRRRCRISPIRSFRWPLIVWSRWGKSPLSSFAQSSCHLLQSRASWTLFLLLWSRTTWTIYSLSGMLILVLVLKDSLRTFFKSLSLSWSLGVRSLSLSLSLGVRVQEVIVLVLVLGGQVLVLILVLVV